MEWIIGGLLVAGTAVVAIGGGKLIRTVLGPERIESGLGRHSLPPCCAPSGYEWIVTAGMAPYLARAREDDPWPT
jgi:hypothetical protein